MTLLELVIEFNGLHGFQTVSDKGATYVYQQPSIS